MRSALCLAFVGLSCVIPAVSAAQPKSTAVRASAANLPVFDFLGQNTETTTTMTALNGDPCTREGKKLTCNDYGGPEIAGQPLMYLSMSYNDEKLYQVISAFGSFGFSKLLSAFTAKYGEPAVETRDWQNRAGASFKNSVAIWKFKGGMLELESIGYKVNQGSFTFISTENAPAEPPPKVDF